MFKARLFQYEGPPEIMKESPCGRFRVTMRRCPWHGGFLYEAWERFAGANSHKVTRTFDPEHFFQGDGKTVWGRIDTRIGDSESAQEEAERLIKSAFLIVQNASSLDGRLLVVMIPNSVANAPLSSRN